MFPNFPSGKNDLSVQIFPELFIILRICQRQELEPRKETHTLEGDTTRGNGKVLHIFFPPNHKEGSEVRCRRPHLGSLSAVQQWFRRASHKKNLQRSGTQDFQILFPKGKTNSAHKKKWFVWRISRCMYLSWSTSMYAGPAHQGAELFLPLQLP